MQLQADISYRIESLFMLLSTAVNLTTSIVMYFLLFTQVKTIGDWNYIDLLYLLALGNIAISIYTMFSWGSIYHQFRPAVKSGDLDYFLLKPKSPYFLLSTGRFDFSGLTRFIPSFVLFIYLLLNYPLTHNLMSLVTFLLISLLGIFLLHTTVFLFYSLSFWTTTTDYFHHLAWAVIGATSMPITVFPQPVQLAFSTIFPVIYAAVIPTRIATGLEPLTLGLILKLLLVPLVSFIITKWVWKHGLSHYSGASA